MKFLKWYSFICVGVSTLYCLRDGFLGNENAFLGAIFYIPIAIYLWKLVIKKEV